MKRDQLGDLTAFMAVAEERSFTRAAAKLGTSQSALSHTIRRLEGNLGLRLLTRTTRAVAPTEAGERLLETLRPALDDIDAKLSALTELREKPSGTIRITTSEHAANTILWPVIKRLMRDNPELNFELSIDQSLTDIVEGRFDAGVRLGESLAKDMIAVPIGPEIRMAAFASRSYLDRYGVPTTPHGLTAHNCINLRLPTLGGLYAWEFERDGRELRVRVEGRLVFNDVPLLVDAALDGLGIGFVPEDHVLRHIREGNLVRLLEDWCPPFPGYHLYYPSRRQPSSGFTLLVDALRYRPKSKPA